MKLNIQLFAGSCSIGTITETTDVNTNQSTFTIPATLTTSGSTYNNDDAYMTLQWKYASGSEWTTISKKTFGIGQNTSKTKSWTLTLTHKDDGTLENINFRVKWYITSSTSGTSSTKTYSPTTIPRASEIDTIQVGFRTNYYPTIKWTPKSASFKFKVKYSYRNWSNISSIISPNTTNQYLYNGLLIDSNIFTDEAYPEIYDALATLYTYQSDGTTLVGSKNFKIMVIALDNDAKPTVTISNLQEADATMQSLNWKDGSNNPIYVQNHSKLSFKTTVSSNVVAAPNTVTTINTNNQTFTKAGYGEQTFITDTLTSSGSKTISATSTERLDRTDSDSKTYNVIAYSNPSISEAKVKRVNSSNVEDDNGTYLNITFKASITSVSNKNTNIFKVGYREKEIGNYTYKTLINNDKTTYSLGNTYVDYRITDWTLNTNKQYDIIFEATDSFTTTTSLRQIETGFDLMNFNASGKAMAIGKVSEAGSNEELLEIALPTYATEKIETTKSLRIPKNSTAGYGLCNSDGTSIIRDHNNTHVTVNATGGTLFLGHATTNELDFLNGKGKMYSDGSLYMPTGFYSKETGNVGTASGTGKLVIKKATSSEAPNNGVVLEFGNSTSWTGQLYIGDNADQGVYYNGWSNGTRGSWKKLAFENSLPSTTTGTLTITKTSGNATATGTYAKYGNVVAYDITLNTTGSTSSGSDIFVGTISNFTPKINTILTGYVGVRPIIASLETSKKITVRNASASSLGSGSSPSIRGTFII